MLPPEARFVRNPCREASPIAERNPYSEWVVATFGAAACLNLVEAVVSPDGWAWTAARAAVAVAFLVAAVLWAELALRRRVHRRGRAPPPP